MRSDAFTGNHASSDKRVTRIHVDGLHHPPLLLTPRQQVIAQHRTVAWPLACSSKSVRALQACQNQCNQVGIYTSSKDDSPIQIQLLVLLLAAIVCFL